MRVEHSRGVPCGLILFCRGEALPLGGDGVEYLRAAYAFESLQGFGHLGDVVAVYWSEITEAHRLEEVSAGGADDVGFHTHHHTLYAASDAAVSHTVPHPVLEFVVFGMGGYAEQVVVHRPRIPVYGYVVVVEYDQQVGVAAAGIVQALVCQASGEGAVSYEGDHLFVAALHFSGPGQSESGGYGGRGVAGPEGVVGAFVYAGEAADASQAPFVAEGFAPAGQYLVGIGLVADIEYDLVVRGVEHLVYAYNQLHRAETRTYVARVGGAATDHIFPDFAAEFLQLAFVEPAEVFGRVYFVQIFRHNPSKVGSF